MIFKALCSYAIANETKPLPPRPLKVPILEKDNTTEPISGTGRIKPSASQVEDKNANFYVLSPSLRSDYEQGFYLGILGGFNFLQDASEPYTASEANFPGSGVFISAELDSQKIGDPLAGLKLGYSWRFTSTGIEILDKNNWKVGMALEFEFIYTHQVLDGRNIAISTEETNITLDNYNFMMNALFLMQNGSWRPYVGVGIGGAYIEGTNFKYVSGLGTELAPDDSIVTLSAQAIAGLEYLLSPGWSIFTEYKLLTTFDLDIYEDEVTSLGFEADMRIDSFMNHYATLGIKKHF